MLDKDLNITLSRAHQEDGRGRNSKETARVQVRIPVLVRIFLLGSYKKSWATQIPVGELCVEGHSKAWSEELVDILIGNILIFCHVMMSLPIVWHCIDLERLLYHRKEERKKILNLRHIYIINFMILSPLQVTA